MTLRVQDLKPGDVVRIDLKVTDCGDLGQPVAFLALVDGDGVNVDDECLAAGNAELVVRPRPVRKGETVLCDGVAWVFVAYVPQIASSVVIQRNGNVAQSVPANWTHADGTPIDWEDSE